MPAVTYTIEQLGTLGGISSEANGCSNDASVVVGVAANTAGNDRAFRWTSAGGMVDLGTLGGGSLASAAGCSADGSVVVGVAFNVSNVQRAFRWTSAGGMVDLGTLGGDLGVARACSDDGSVVVGQSRNASNFLRAFRWTSAGGMVDLGTLGGSFADALACSADGSVVVGTSFSSTAGAARAFRWTSAGGMVDLGTLGGPSSTEYFALGCSDDGAIIVGFSQDTSGVSRAFRWTASGGMVDLGTLGGVAARAQACSADGAVIVGYATDAAENGRAFRWTASGGMVDLGTLGGPLSIANASAADGAIVVGYSSVSSNQAVRWVPNAPAVADSPIEFEPMVTSPDTRGDLIMSLPPPRALCSDSAQVLVMELPSVGLNVTSGGMQEFAALVMNLPPLTAFASSYEVGLDTVYEGFVLMTLPPPEFDADNLVALVPANADLLADLPLIDFDMVARQSVFGTLDMELPPLLGLLFENNPGNYLIADLSPIAFGASFGLPIANTFVSAMATPFVASFANNTVLMSSNFVGIDALTDEVFFVLNSRLQVDDQYLPFATMIMELQSNAALRGFMSFALDLILNDAITLGDEVIATPEAVMALASMLVLQDEHIGWMSAVQTVATALVLADTLRMSMGATIDSAVDLVDAIEANLNLIMALVSQTELLDEMSGTLHVSVLLDSQFAGADTFIGLLTAVMNLDDAVTFAVRFTTPEGDVFAGYMMNVRSSAMSELTNYPFNSFATLKNGGRVVTLGFGRAGAYSLDTGNTDAGAPIPARVRLGLTDFGTSQLKRTANAILGYTSDGQLLMKVITTDGGRKKENWYTMKARTADSPVEGRIDIAKGLTARYFGFAVENINGAAFQLDDLRVFPAVLQRRKSGR